MIHPQLLETLYQLMETEHTTMATEGLHYGKAGVRPKAGGWKIRTDRPPRSFYLENKKAFKYFYKSILRGVGGKMIRRRAICSLRFKEDLSQGEDTLFIYQLLAGGADVSVLCCNWYYYRMHKRNASKDLSIAACRSKYKVERYICDSEMRSGRKENAIGKEWYILETMTVWYETGRRCRNAAFMKYTKNLIKAERRLKIFRQLCCWMKLYYYSFLYCYPFSKIILKVERTVWKICDSSKRYIKSQ